MTNISSSSETLQLLWTAAMMYIQTQCLVSGCASWVKVSIHYDLCDHTNVEEDTQLSMRALIRLTESLLVLGQGTSVSKRSWYLPARQQMESSWAVQVLLAAHHSVIEMFISPLLVWEPMSINRAHSHHWNFGEAAATPGSFPCQGQVRFAKVRAGCKINQKHCFWNRGWAEGSGINQ